MRGTGLVVMVLLTLTTALGVTSTLRAGSRLWPRFVTQSLHRNLSLLASALLVAHIVTAVVHTYVDIRLVDVVVPFIGPYEPLWVGLGALATDAIVVVVATSLIRPRLSHRAWRATHLLSYAGWALGLVHGLGLGTDATATTWGLAICLGCGGLVFVACALRAVTFTRERRLVS